MIGSPKDYQKIIDSADELVHFLLKMGVISYIRYSKFYQTEFTRRHYKHEDR